MNEKYKNSGLLKTPIIKQLSIIETNEMLDKWHYLGKVKGVLFSFGHNEGCCVFTNCRSRIYEQKMNAKKIYVIELARMVGKPNHKWAMSSLMAECTKKIKQLFKYDLIVTYSDPFAGHDGMTYKASGWILDCIIKPDGHPLFFIDEKRISPRTLYDRHGTQSIKKMQEIYKNRLVLKEKPLKKRFIKILNKKLQKKYNKLIKK